MTNVTHTDLDTEARVWLNGGMDTNPAPTRPRAAAEAELSRLRALRRTADDRGARRSTLDTIDASIWWVEVELGLTSTDRP